MICCTVPFPVVFCGCHIFSIAITFVLQATTRRRLPMVLTNLGKRIALYSDTAEVNVETTIPHDWSLNLRHFCFRDREC